MSREKLSTGCELSTASLKKREGEKRHSPLTPIEKRGGEKGNKPSAYSTGLSARARTRTCEALSCVVVFVQRDYLLDSSLDVVARGDPHHARKGRRLLGVHPGGS